MPVGFCCAAQVWISKAGGYGGQAVRAKHTRPRCSAVLMGVLESFDHQYFLGVNTTGTTRSDDSVGEGGAPKPRRMYL